MEEKIISLLKAQDTEAISLLYDKYSTILYGIILRIVHSREVAQDVLQETFVKAWRYGCNYDSSKGKLLTWLLNIARNTAIDVTRSGVWKMSERTNDLTCLESFGEQVIKTDHIGLKDLVDKLDPKQRVLIDMIYFQGYTHQEIEKELNIPLGTVKTRLRSAVMGLRKVFSDTHKADSANLYH